MAIFGREREIGESTICMPVMYKLFRILGIVQKINQSEAQLQRREIRLQTYRNWKEFEAIEQISVQQRLQMSNTGRA